MVLAKPVQPNNTIKSTMYHTFLPNRATRAMRRGSHGRLNSTSTSLMRNSSTTPPKYPAVTPTVIPIDVTKTAASRPMDREILDP